MKALPFIVVEDRQNAALAAYKESALRASEEPNVLSSTDARPGYERFCELYTHLSTNSGPGGRTKVGLVYAASPRLTRYSIGLREPREILSRFSLHQRMYESTAAMNCSMVAFFQSRG
ncbi:hypothetical protein SAMN05444746_12760 [Variovorax sp. OK212]|nr:hypothetical protein SAMN05518853_12760 [Variovorax sp. OK202]SFE53399.1 hypothetical protein SAMN05444746_12760 [Variovorax sp. OK212]